VELIEIDLGCVCSRVDLQSSDCFTTYPFRITEHYRALRGTYPSRITEHDRADTTYLPPQNYGTEAPQPTIPANF
jgi:hypothetical protein